MNRTLQSALTDDNLVQSFSGVRTVFGLGPKISTEHETLAFIYGYCYALTAIKKQEPVFLIGRDPRPTGIEISRHLAKGFLTGATMMSCGLRLIDLGIITTPLAETAIRALQADGGVMVTASHNPLDNNGFKFLTGAGWTTSDSAPAGALLSAKAMGKVISLVNDPDSSFLDEASVKSLRWTDEALEIALDDPQKESLRVKAERAYLDTIGEDWGIAPHCLKPLTLGPVLLDPNGGAGSGIDARVLEHFGVNVIEVNAELGYPEHPIDTDGIDPVSGRHRLLRVARAAARERAHFGVAFDYDADRGNMALPGQTEDAILPPQQVASLNIALALTRRKLLGQRNGQLAVVLSDATSLASHRIAEEFGAKIFEVETGEINVVTKMYLLRSEGYDCPVGVEGANGGTIFERSTCRDGLQVALATAQAESNHDLMKLWMETAKKFGTVNHNGSPDNYTLKELIDSIPVFFNEMMRMTCPVLAPALVKKRLEKKFKEMDWPILMQRFRQYEFQNFEEMETPADRSGDESGGWRVMLDKRAFIFVRGSKTEPSTWRVIVDAEREDDFQVLKDTAARLFKSATEI